MLTCFSHLGKKVWDMLSYGISVKLAIIEEHFSLGILMKNRSEDETVLSSAYYSANDNYSLMHPQFNADSASMRHPAPLNHTVLLSL